jgi:hypothetical protein
MYWHVDDIAATFEKLLLMGAREYQPITPRGDKGFVTAAVVDPFGNVRGSCTTLTTWRCCARLRLGSGDDRVR